MALGYLVYQLVGFVWGAFTCSIAIPSTFLLWFQITWFLAFGTGPNDSDVDFWLLRSLAATTGILVGSTMVVVTNTPKLVVWRESLGDGYFFKIVVLLVSLTIAAGLGQVIYAEYIGSFTLAIFNMVLFITAMLLWNHRVWAFYAADKKKMIIMHEQKVYWLYFTIFSSFCILVYAFFGVFLPGMWQSMQAMIVFAGWVLFLILYYIFSVEYEHGIEGEYVVEHTK